jgi:gliding motility-associated-like protein
MGPIISYLCPIKMMTIYPMKQFQFLLILLFPIALTAQEEGLIWYFGSGAGLDFSSGDPVVLTDGAIETFEGCATYCDSEGNLLFYTNGGGRPAFSGQDGGTIWNRDHEVMYDMAGEEGGGFSARQSSLIIPKPQTPDVYLLFTMEEGEFLTGGSVPGQPNGRGLSYFEVDMTLNGGLGGVTLADQRIFLPVFEALSGTIHADEERYWILAAQATVDTNRFVRVLVDENGPQEPEFVPIDTTTRIGGSIKISPSSEWIYSRGNLFNFDNSSGAISQTVTTLHSENVGRSISFSSNSRYCYVVEQLEDAVELVQYDLTAVDIEASRNLVETLPSDFVYGQMQLAPDGNLYYLSVPFFDNENVELNVVRCPNTAEPSVESDVLDLPEVMSDLAPYFGLPNYTDHLFANTGVSFDIDLGADSTLCQGDVLLLGDTLPALGNTYEWSTGDTTATIEVEESDLYSLTVTSEECGILTDTVMLEFIDCDTACLIVMPNAFTPNGDNTNEEFGFVSNCEEPTFEEYSLVVYNRWGELVFETQSPGEKWDGNQDDGTPAPSEVYFYYFNYQVTEGEEPAVLQGNVSLVR